MRSLRGRGLRTTLIVAAMAAAPLGVAGMSANAATHHAPQVPNACATVHQHSPGHFGGMLRPAPTKASLKALCRSKFDSAANGTPPLIFHGGNVMDTNSTGAVTVTPIYWNPTGHTMTAAYKNLISQYWADIAHDSGMVSNVFSVLTEYSGANGGINYNIVAGAPISDTNALPRSGCTVAANDRNGIYSDGTGYNACLDDAQIQAQTNSVIAAHGLAKNLAHVYVLYLPKAVESCINAGSTTSSSNECSINHNPSAAFCAYHSEGAATMIYADLVFPVYTSGTGFTCGSDAKFPVVESPNGNVDADVEISPSSHEVNEAITDPDTSTGWYDSSGFENGDECAYVYDATAGAAGALFNQTVNGHHYLTQTEFSNKDFAVTGLGCLES
jgi:hypothetical protein